MFIKWEEEKVGYALLSLVIGFEILGTNLLKLSVGFTRVGIGITSLACYGVSFYLMALSYQKLPANCRMRLASHWQNKKRHCDVSCIILSDQTKMRRYVQ